LSYQVADELRFGQLQTLLADFTPGPMPVSLVYAMAEPLPLKARSFLNRAVPRLRTGITDLESKAI